MFFGGKNRLTEIREQQKKMEVHTYGEICNGNGSGDNQLPLYSL